MEETPEVEGAEGELSNPRLQAIMELIKYLAQSEGSRAAPKPAPAPVAPETAPEGEPDLDELEALKSLAR